MRWVLVAAGALLLTACPSDSTGPMAPTHPTLLDGGETSVSMAQAEAEEGLFTHRCSKCHSLSRILDLGFREETFWRRYVHRMRLQPASGIAADEEAPILRHLVRISESKRERKDAPSP